MSRELIPVAYYNAVAIPVDTDNGTTFAQFGKTKEGNKQVCITFEILDGDYAGRRVSWFGYFTEKTYKRTIESLRYCGFRGDDLMSIPEQALDQQVSISVEHNEWDGKVTARVGWVNGVGGGGLKLSNPMAKDELRMFAAQMKSHVAGIAEAPGQKGERGATPAPINNGAPADNDGRGDPDDLPF